MSGLTDTLAKPAGPLPVGAWIAVIGGGLGIAWWTRKNSTGSSTSDSTTPTTLEDAVGAGASGFTNSNQVTTPAVASGPTTNDQWASLALTWAATNTNYSLTLVSNAISKYFAGTQRTVEEETVLNSLFRQVGAPPVPGPEAPYAPTPTTPVVTPPNNGSYVGPAKKKSWKTDNIAYPQVANWEAVLLYYYDNVAPAGTARALQMYKLIAANSGKSFKSGMKVILPNTI